MTSSKKLGAAGLAVALGVSTMAALAAGPAQAASSTTAGYSGAPASLFGVTSYSSTPRNVAITAVQDGSDIDVAVTVAVGPDNPISEAAAGSYRLDAFVRLGGNADTRGTRMVGTVGAPAVPVMTPYYPSGTTINGTFKGVGAGTFKVTLTDLLLEGQSGTSPNCPTGNTFGSKADGSDTVCFDAWYNKTGGMDPEPVVKGTGAYKSIELSQSVTLTGVAVGDRKGPNVKVGKIAKKAKKVKALQGRVKDVGTAGAQSVSVKVVQKRGKKWVAYDGTTWKKAKNQKRAVKRAALLTDTSVASGKWKVKVKKVKPGRLVVKYSGTDKLGNVSKTKTKKAKLK